MLKQGIKLIALITVMVLFSGCPYGTELEMTGAEKVNEAYLGQYEKQSSSYYYATISKNSDYEYRIVKYRLKDDEIKETGIGKVYNIGGTGFLVVKRETKSSYSYNKKSYIYKFMPSKSGYIMKLQGVSDYVTEEFETAAELKKYIEKYKDLSFFYQKRVDKYYKADEE